jgi:hypothetical protein
LEKAAKDCWPLTQFFTRSDTQLPRVHDEGIPTSNSLVPREENLAQEKHEAMKALEKKLTSKNLSMDIIRHRAVLGFLKMQVQGNKLGLHTSRLRWLLEILECITT